MLTEYRSEYVKSETTTRIQVIIFFLRCYTHIIWLLKHKRKHLNAEYWPPSQVVVNKEIVAKRSLSSNLEWTDDFAWEHQYDILCRRIPVQYILITLVSTIRVFTCLKTAIKFYVSFLYRYILRATSNHEADQFTATIIDSSYNFLVFNDLEGVKEVNRSLLCVETAVYVLKN